MRNTFLAILLFLLSAPFLKAQTGPTSDFAVALPTHSSMENQDASLGIGIQMIALGTGFNWVSACVETSLDDLKAALLTALPNATSLKINSQSNGYTNYSGSRWRGTMNTWDASQMYIIEVPEACEITLTGAPIRPEDHPVSMAPGNNWIAFPLNASMSVTDAFSGFPINGDKVSSQSNGFTNYTNRWRGTLGTLEAGKGYIYNSASTENRSFIFPVNAEKTMKGLVR